VAAPAERRSGLVGVVLALAEVLAVLVEVVAVAEAVGEKW
jgi:hypothetical protein